MTGTVRARLSSLPVQLALAVLVAAAVGIGVGLGSGSLSPPGPPPLDLPADERPADAPPGDGDAAAGEAAPGRGSARQVFAHTCGMCHTLADAKTVGGFGPDLDAVRPSAAEVRRMIRTGSIDGVMQPGLLTGAEARRVAAYIARVAGRRR
jgi:cytochrome c6